jgi:hypothetical protein
MKTYALAHAYLKAWHHAKRVSPIIVIIYLASWSLHR